MIPISRPDIGSDEEQAVLDVLRSGMIAMGRRTAEFEEAWAAYCGVRHAVLMANGTVALEAVLRALGIGPGDEVVTVSFTFNATVSAILQTGARPVFVDVRADDFCMDPERVEAAITPRTRAIMPVHLYGLMADMDPLVEIAERHGIPIVEDAAQAHGAPLSRPTRWTIRPGDVQPVRDQEPDDGRGRLCHDRRRRARRPAAPVPQPRYAGALRARSAGDQLQAHGDRGRAGAGTARLASTSGPPSAGGTPPASARGWTATMTPLVPDGREHVWHQYTMRFPGERQTVVDGLAKRGIGTLIYYPIPVHRQAYLQAFVPNAADLDLPVTNRLADEVLAIPVRPNLAPDELERVIDAIREVATPTQPAATSTGTRQ